jgi:PKD repeat protein
MCFLAAFVLGGWAAAADVIKVEATVGPSFVGNAPDKCIFVIKEGTQPLQSAAKSGIAVTGVAVLDEIAQKFQVNRFEAMFPAANMAQKAYATDRVLTRYYRAQFPEGNLDAVMDALRKLPFVESVEPVGLYRVTATPNDKYYDEGSETFPYYQWHYWQTYGINADTAWDKETGDPNVVVAVIDGGVRYYHSELGGTNPPGPADNSTNGNIWVNTGEIPGNSTDDDGNGYVDDVVGWDFVASSSYCNDADCSGADNDPRDGMGHGTHVAGTIAAITNNNATWGVAGIAGGWNDGTPNVNANGVKIMCLRAGWSSVLGGLMSMDYISQALYYVATMVDKGFNVTAVNCSWGSSSIIAAATNAVIARDVMMIVAAGNDNSQTQDYLASRGDCLDVGATDTLGYPADFSNYGSWVDIAAPGVNILSTYHNPSDPTYDYIALMDGTSMSCPHVVGVAALLESYSPSLTAAQKRNIILTNYKPYNMTKDVGDGIVDAGRCINAVAPPCDVNAAFTGTPTDGCKPLTVTFTDQSTGPVTSWSWNFGDGGNSTLQNPTHQYTSTGPFTVSLTVTSATCNDTETKTNYIMVRDVPVAGFVGVPTSGYVPFTVTFTDQSTGYPTSWQWDFGDAGTSTLQNPTHQYTTAGNYTVTLTVSNACGSDVEQKVNYITASTPVQQCDDFADGNITNWGNKRGTWTATGGYMKGNSTTTDSRTTSPFGSFSTATINCDVRMNTGRTQRNARIVFGYADGSNYRYIQGDDVNDRWTICERVAGTNYTRATFSRAISTATWYAVQVKAAADGNVTLTVGGVTVGSYKFSAVKTGLVGCGYNKANSDFDNFCVGSSVTSIVAMDDQAFNRPEPLPEAFELGQNYPNPFNPITTIKFNLPYATQVRLDIFNILGQRVETVVDEVLQAGPHSFTWDGGQMASGIYLYRLTTDNFTSTRKMVLMK